MKKYWYCEGVDESWITAESDDGWQNTVRQYEAKYARHPGGPYYLASDVDARIAELEKALVNLVVAHNGYHLGAGPCICAAHEEARRVTGMTRDDVHPARSL